VTPLVKNGQNAIGAMLGNGWYAGCLAYTGRRNWYGGNARLLAQLVVEHTDGTVQTIATDSSWKAAFGPVRQADLLLGCVYDDRQSIAGWDLPGFNDHKWATVDSLTASGSGDSSDETARLRRLITNGSLSLTVSNDTMGGDPAYDQVKNLRVVYTVGGARKTVSVGEQEQLNLSGSDLAIVSATYGPATNVAGAPAKAGPIIEAQKSEPVRIQDVLSVVKLTQPKPGLWVFDLGQNMVGWTRLKISGTSGQKIVVLHGEMLNPDGTVYVANLRSATGADEYILSGNGVESLEPMFTLKGFRYVEVRGLTAPPTPDMVHGVVVYSNMARTGDFECSNPLVNQLYHNIIWGQKGNYIAVPTDCPQRDERAGWTGDTEFFMRTGAYNYDVSGFFSNWLMTMCEDSQHADGSFANVAPDIGSGSGATAWGDAALQCTYHMYQMYGDTRVISEHYAAMSRYMDFLAARSTNGITNVGGFEDWLNLGGGANPRVIDTAFYAYLSGIMSDMAGAIGKTDDAAKFRQLHDQVKAAFASNFINADGSIKDSSQTAYALAFTMGLIPDALHDASATAYVNEVQKFNWHLATGFIGTPRLLPSLHMAGHDDVAYKLLEQDTYPGWLFQVKLGATTMWERWDGWTPDRGFQTIGMNSFNHYAFGAVGEYLYSGVAGIDTDGPSFDKITIRPEPGGDLTYARSSYNSIHGLIVSSWKTTGKTLSLDVTIPANTTATVYVPCNDGVVTESGVPAGQAIGVKFLRKEPNACVYSIGSGTYHFVSPQA
jgi:alpha-L-rhamnosidase